MENTRSVGSQATGKKIMLGAIPDGAHLRGGLCLGKKKIFKRRGDELFLRARGGTKVQG